MKILIFGATGSTGQHLVQQALAAGHTVTAFVRDPTRLRVSHPNLTCCVADVMDRASVQTAMPGHDTVLCALGDMPETKGDAGRRQPRVPVCSVGTGNIVATMTASGVRRIVVESAACVGESQQAGRWGASAIIRFVLRAVMLDKEAQDAALRQSSLDWTLVRPPRLNNGPVTGGLRAGVGLSWGLLSRASRADVAAFMLHTLSDASTVHQAITVTY